MTRLFVIDGEYPKIRELLAEPLVPVLWLEAGQHLQGNVDRCPGEKMLLALQLRWRIANSQDLGLQVTSQLEQLHLQLQGKSESPLAQPGSRDNRHHLFLRAQNPARRTAAMEDLQKKQSLSKAPLFHKLKSCSYGRKYSILCAQVQPIMRNRL